MDQTIVSPTYIPDMIDACLDLLIDGERGRWHLVNEGAISWADLTQQVADSRGLKSTNRMENAMTIQHRSVSHPVSYALRSERGQLLPSLDDALSRYLWERKREQEQPVA